MTKSSSIILSILLSMMQRRIVVTHFAWSSSQYLNIYHSFFLVCLVVLGLVVQEDPLLCNRVKLFLSSNFSIVKSTKITNNILINFLIMDPLSFDTILLGREKNSKLKEKSQRSNKEYTKKWYKINVLKKTQNVFLYNFSSHKNHEINSVFIETSPHSLRTSHFTWITNLNPSTLRN